MRANRRHRVRFLPEGVWTELETGLSLRDAARRVGINITGACGGEGTCGKCLVRILNGKARIEKGTISPAAARAGYQLACRTFPLEDMTVEVPVESRAHRGQAVTRHVEIEAAGYETGLERYPLRPVARKVRVRLDAPTLVENASDHTRFMAGLGRALRLEQEGGEEAPAGGQPVVEAPLEVIRRLPRALRESGWDVSATVVEMESRCEVTRIEPQATRGPALGVAVDIGTTTIAVYLVDLEEGRTLERLATYNEQFIYGEDVISRIIHATRTQRGLSELQRRAVGTVNRLIRQAARNRGVRPQDIACAVVAGNTTMTHLFLGVEPRYIRLEPYIPAAVDFPPIRAREVGLEISPEGRVFSFPCVASYVGGDVVAGVLATGIGDRDEVGLFVDIGTNGEMVLGNRDYLVSCACSAGPAFEGGGISCGVRAVPGAVQRVEIDRRTLSVRVETVGDEKPLGVCGSGLVEALAAMRRAGVIDRSGNFQEDMDSWRLRRPEGGGEFVLVTAAESAVGRDIFISEADVKNLLRSKAAVYAGIRCLLKGVGLSLGEITRVYVAGGFGSYLDARRAIEIGLLPDIGVEKYVVVGNTAVKGARLGLLSRRALDAARELARRMTYLELSVGAAFMEEFVSASFLPHTDLGQFPSVPAD